MKIDGIGGDTTELHQNLHACLSVGRYKRAAAIVRRLADLFNPTTPELVEAHNVYLRGLTNALAHGRIDGYDAMKKIRYWFEVEMRAKGVAVNGATYAIICKAAMVGLPRDAQVRTIRRYLHFAEQDSLLEDTIASGELTEEEYGLLVELRHEILSADLISDLPAEALAEKTAEQATPPEWLDVKPVSQKGLGLQSLKDSLISIYNIDNVPYPHDMKGSKEQKDRKWAEMRQEKLEEDVVDVAIARWKEEHEHMLKMGINTKLSSRTMEASLWQWQNSLEQAIKDELVDIQKALADEGERDSQRAEYGPYFEAIKPEKMAGITILLALQHCVKNVADGCKIAYLSKKIGVYLERESLHTGISANARAAHQKENLERRKNLLKRLGRATNTPAETATSPVEQSDAGPWPTHIQLHVGALLLSKLIDTAMVPVKAHGKNTTTMEPAFRHCVEFEKGKKVGKMRAQDQLRDKLMKAPLRASVGLSGHMPMLVEPKKWRSLKDGPYYRYSPLLVRHKDEDDVQVMYAKAASEKGHLSQVYKGLDVLGKTAWRINQDVLKVMLEAWNSGEAVADLAPENPEKSFPPEPDSSAPAEAKKAWRNEVRRIENEISGLHSQRCFTNLQLEVAKAYADKTFFYPHNIDFRGRAYPVPPFLNHMGADSARGLLTFDKGKPLGEIGLRWLKIHLSNLAGFDKASLDERVQYTMDHMDDIIDSATNSLGGQRWWLKAEDPWQCLAACFELKAAMELPDPTQYISHIPVAQDGSCNGLQHYAALGGDTFGASQVNLAPSERPADVYSGVAKLVKEAVQKDADAGEPMAKVLLNKITRKVVKQTVMTNVYGVTFVGARAQVQKQLDAIMEDKSECDISNYALSSYVAKKVFKALATMFEGAHNIQYWLGECADRITRAITPEQIRMIIDRREGKAPEISRKYKDAAWKYWAKKNAPTGQVQPVDFRTSVIWTTPLNLPVVQPYRAAKGRDVVTSLQHISFKEPRAYDPVNRRRQLQAFPPNFVHSLDATHMLLSALKCDEAGLTFAAVHDSFWTHAADVSTMGSILRDAFIKMHKDDVIGRLASEFQARYKGSLHLATVYARSPLGERILALRRERQEAARRGKEWKGSSLKTKTLQNELLEEWERQQLLQSDDAEEQAKGQAMKTPGALFAQALNADDFKVPSQAATTSSSTSSSVEAELDEAMESDMEDVEGAQQEDDPNAIEGEERGINIIAKIAKRMNRKSTEQKVVVWAPLIFPAVPQKGDFDVERVRDSTYFFA
jgi:DNA-directed RNA polymerase